jgi:hypothetical protein
LDEWPTIIRIRTEKFDVDKQEDIYFRIDINDPNSLAQLDAAMRYSISTVSNQMRKQDIMSMNAEKAHAKARILSGECPLGVRYEDGRSPSENGWFFETGELVDFFDVSNIGSRDSALRAGIPARVLDLYEADGGSYSRSEGNCDLKEWLFKNIG